MERLDSWTPKEDNILTDIVLHYIATGGIQLDAFEEAGNKLGRTAGACGFRWNSIIRHKNAQKVRDAKINRLKLGKSRHSRHRMPKVEVRYKIGFLSEVEAQALHKLLEKAENPDLEELFFKIDEALKS